MTGTTRPHAKTRAAARALLLLAALLAMALAFACATAQADPAVPEQGEPETESAETEQVHGDEAQGDVVKADIARLVQGDIELNGETVRFRGEVVGVPIAADNGHMWLQVDDNGTGIAVFLRDSLSDQVKYYGSYDFIGDTVEITGIYHFDCAAHQGDLDVHAVDMSVVKSGEPIEHGEGLGRLWPAIWIVVAGAVCGIVYWRLRERMR